MPTGEDRSTADLAAGRRQVHARTRLRQDWFGRTTTGHDRVRRRSGCHGDDGRSAAWRQRFDRCFTISGTRRLISSINYALYHYAPLHSSSLANRLIQPTCRSHGGQGHVTSSECAILSHGPYIGCRELSHALYCDVAARLHLEEFEAAPVAVHPGNGLSLQKKRVKRHALPPCKALWPPRLSLRLSKSGS